MEVKKMFFLIKRNWNVISGLNIVLKGEKRKMVKRTLLSITLITLMISFSFATLNQAWRVDVGSVGYFQNDGANRGMCYNPATDTILVARTTPSIVILDASSGASTGFINMSGVSGGSGAALTKVRATSDGVIYACNMITADTTSDFSLYRWTNEGASVTTTFRNRSASSASFGVDSVGMTLPVHGTATAYRIGDSMDVVKSGDTVQFYLGITLSAGTAPVIYKLSSYNNGLSIDSIEVINCLGGGAGTNRGVVADENGRLYHFTNSAIARWNADGTNKVSIPTIAIASGSAFPKVKQINGRNYILYIDAGTFGGGGYRRGGVAEFNSTWDINSAKFVDWSLTSTTVIANTNAAGDCDFDTNRNRFIFMVTNNLIGSYYSDATVRYFDNGGADNEWNTAANWNPDGVPTGLDDVVLDNSLITSNYKVNLALSTYTAMARKLTIEGTGGNTVTFEISNGLSTTMFITGTASPDTSFFIKNGGIVICRSTAASAPVIQIKYPGSQFVIADGGYAMWSTARSFNTAFPSTGDGRLICSDNSNLEFAKPGALTSAGRTFGNLICSSDGTLYQPGPSGSGFIVNGSLICKSNVEWICTSSNVTIKRNITFDGTTCVFYGSGYKVFNGLSQQTISGSGLLFAIGSCYVDNASGLYFDRNAYILNQIYLYNGDFSYGTYQPIIPSMARTIPAATGSYDFQLFDGVTSHHATVNFTSAPTAGTLTATFIPANPGTSGIPVTDTDTESISYVAPEGYWAINGLSDGTYNLTLDAEGFGLGDSSYLSQVRILKRVNSASSWSVDGTPGTNSGTSIARTGLTGFSEFGIGGNSYVPVELSDFMTE